MVGGFHQHTASFLCKSLQEVCTSYPNSNGVSRAVTHGVVSPETGDGLKDTEDPGASCGLRAAPFMALSLSFLICKMGK